MAKKAKKGKRNGGRLVTLVNLAAAAAGLASLARDLMQRHEQAKASAAEQLPDPDEGRAPQVGAPAGPARQTAAAGGGALRAIDTALDTVQALLNVNDATPDALRRLSPITKKRAKRIVARRPFKQVKELKRVLPKGAYRAIKRQLTV
jgi:DNA uptake protein ComE-like DNA-binding protein